jgi:hypothetical protein
VLKIAQFTPKTIQNDSRKSYIVSKFLFLLNKLAKNGLHNFPAIGESKPTPKRQKLAQSGHPDLFIIYITANVLL